MYEWQVGSFNPPTKVGCSEKDGPHLLANLSIRQHDIIYFISFNESTKFLTIKY